MASLMERLAFLQKVPTLMKATADDESPCPGYLFQDIGKISHESSGCGQCLLEYLLDRLQVESCHVKLKVLKIFVHLCGHGSNTFLTELRRNSTFIQQASVYSGPPDPIHGTALYQKVRNTAQEVARLLFTDAISTKFTSANQTMGMGSVMSNRSGMQGFGYTSGKQGAAGADSLLDKIQKAAEVVASAVLPPTEHQGIRLQDNHYRAVVAPSAPIEVAVPACTYTLTPLRPKAMTQRCPGQVGGGWEETDSGTNSSHNSSQDMAANSRASVDSKSAGTGSQSGASRESSGDLSERVEALQLGDCGQEMALISRLTEGSKVFLSREESQHFIKECSILNCEVVVELLSRKLQESSSTVKMRALCALACLMTSDLLSLEQMFGATQRRLRQLNNGPAGPVANKATKILRQFEALMSGPLHAPRQDAATSSHAAITSQLPVRTHRGGSSGEQRSEDRTEEREEESAESRVDHVRTIEAEVDLTAEDPELLTARGSPPAAKPQSEQPHLGRLSLFSGMEMVNKGRPVRDGANAQTEMDTLAVDQSDNPVNSCHSSSDVAPLASCVASVSCQPVSAFSFLNF
ncbi:AP-4 complex accessory subunit Tepsin [Genypterus blacodes]|uniref:AP-4 complex accessory subunit Tepsin n=1 Tax=Genypterus blacodes TaxID=154954 RepID=UPI003F763735